MPRDTSRNPRTAILLAAVTGAVSGVVRAVVGWLLRNFTVDP
ncbi:hypothetical protein [Micromonospora sonneratiae]|uniref:Fluoride ion transporter CrcB n=1 Tax=Micromonospora sonneratiae TaxID=1184706 RepID=A0ABW3YRF6_9ACTN